MTKAAALSPSRANDFRKCPLQFRLIVVDQIPSQPAPARERGTLVHSVLEELFDCPPTQRSAEFARTLIEPHWQKMVAANPDLESQLFDTDFTREVFLNEAAALVDKYFSLENPTRLEPAHREVYVRTQIGDGLNIHGFLDRVDVSSDNQVRIVDYKTGKAPSLAYISPYVFQLRFYALAWRKLYGVTPRLLQLLFLKTPCTYAHTPTDSELDATEEELLNLWAQIKRAAVSENFVPRRSPLCNWCDVQALCPLFGGDPGPVPAAGIDRLLTMHQ